MQLLILPYEWQFEYLGTEIANFGNPLHQPAKIHHTAMEQKATFHDVSMCNRNQYANRQRLFHADKNHNGKRHGMFHDDEIGDISVVHFHDLKRQNMFHDVNWPKSTTHLHNYWPRMHAIRALPSVDLVHVTGVEQTRETAFFFILNLNTQLCKHNQQSHL